MNKIIISRIIIFVMFLIVFTYSASASLELKVVNKQGEGQAAVESRKGELIVEVRRGAIDLGEEKGIIPQEKVNIKADSLKALNKKYAIVSIEKLFSGTRQDVPSDIYVFRFPSQFNLNELVSAYSKDSNIIYAEPNYIVRTQ